MLRTFIIILWDFELLAAGMQGIECRDSQASECEGAETDLVKAEEAYEDYFAVFIDGRKVGITLTAAT